MLKMFRRVFNRVSPFIHNIRTISSDIQIIEVGLRDGLQSHKTFIPTDNKKKLIDKLGLAGISDIEATAFVSQKAVPQMSDCNEIMNYCNKTYGADNITFSALVPNMHFFEKSLYSYSKKVAIFTTVSETFCEKNIRCSISKSLENYKEICKKSQKMNIDVRGYVSCIAGCPYEGSVGLNKIIRVCNELLEMGCSEVSIGDTIGIGNPVQIDVTIAALIFSGIPANKIAVHFHDTNGNALDNIKVALDRGVTRIDSSINGLGGCPFAPGAPGNVATESVVEMLHDLGCNTGIDTELLEKARKYANEITI